MRGPALALAVALAASGSAAQLVGCDVRPQAIVLCHNANCAGATDPARDDTLERLDESLRLEYLGRPAIDGIEVDALFDAETGTCLFAHDFESATGTTAMEAAERVVKHLAQPTDFVSWGGNRFFLKIEAKAAATPLGDPADPVDLARHIGCVLDMADLVVAEAIAGQRELEILFEAEEVRFLRAMVADPRWPGKHPAADVRYRLVANVKADGLRPSDLESLGPGETEDGLDVLSFHATRFPDGQQQAYDGLDVDLMLWMLDAALETFYVAEVFAPKYIDTSEAILIRRWMED